jgi:REP element-mobilizing transposase RayT
VSAFHKKKHVFLKEIFADSTVAGFCMPGGIFMPWFETKYRLESTRLKNWDYSLNGCYFVTICTKQGRHFFGQVSGGEVQLSQMGRVAEQFWMEILSHFSGVVLDRFIVMPNHVHGTVGIWNGYKAPVSPEPSFVSAFGPLKPGSLSVIMGSYKAAVTRWCHRNGYADFDWQPRFRDQGISDERSLNNIREYIGRNPERWELKRKR